MYTRPVKHIMGAIALFAAFAAWGRDISIESVNRSAGGDIESVTLGFTAADEPSFLYLASDTEDKGTVEQVLEEVLQTVPSPDRGTAG